MLEDVLNQDETDEIAVSVVDVTDEVITRFDHDLMTYAEIGKRLGFGPDGGRACAKREKWKVMPSTLPGQTAIVKVPKGALDEVAAKSKPPLNKITAVDAADFFAVLSNPDRLLILHALSAGKEKSVSQLAERLRVDAQKISIHMKHLKEKGLVNSRKHGVNVYYTISQKMPGEVLKVYHRYM